MFQQTMASADTRSQVLYKVFSVATALLVCSAVTVNAKYCYQCDSTLDSNCQEKWDDSLSTNQVKNQECNMWQARFCIKVTGLWGGVVGTHRFCSSRDMGDQCQDVWFPDHDRMYRACVYTCSGDGCNSGSKLTNWSVAVVSALWLLQLLWRQL